MTIKHAASKHRLNARQTVAFIRNRHCSQVLLTASLSDAINLAEFHRQDEETIANDICTVGYMGDLCQYTRNSQPFKK